MLITHIWDLIQSSFLGALYAWAHLMPNNSKSYSNIPFHFRALEKEMATHSNVFA